ncbi:MAG: class I SAM-dependent methyltransferase [Saprospiraceae bacterium]|nr:class I SAM-dependent methyltransferase [Saprospiraceae bacterium]
MRKINDQKALRTLNRLHGESSREMGKILKGLSKGIFRKLQPKDMKDTYIAISRSQGEFLYNLLVENRAKNIIEFGTSFGISTLYLAAAAKTNGGKVITTELLPEKCAVAQKNFEEAGLEDFIELREGDALQTLRHLDDSIDFLLMDGWNDLYLPLLQQLEPFFKDGTIIYTDNASFKSAKPYLDYIYSRPEMYKSRRIGDDKGGSELTTVAA